MYVTGISHVDARGGGVGGGGWRGDNHSSDLLIENFLGAPEISYIY